MRVEVEEKRVETYYNNRIVMVYDFKYSYYGDWVKEAGEVIYQHYGKSDLWQALPNEPYYFTLGHGASEEIPPEYLRWEQQIEEKVTTCEVVSAWKEVK